MRHTYTEQYGGKISSIETCEDQYGRMRRSLYHMLLFTAEFYCGQPLTIFTTELSEHYMECINSVMCIFGSVIYACNKLHLCGGREHQSSQFRHI
jgi:hypothetical protein